MKNLLTVLLLLSPLLIVGCGDSRVNENDIQKRNGKVYLPNSQEPFSGTVFAVYSDLGEGFGQTESETQYEDGIQHGEHVQFYKNGQISLKGEYKNGKEDGEFFNYMENGELVSEIHMKNGIEHGPWIEYRSNGEIATKVR